MKSMNDLRCISKRSEERLEGSLVHSQPFNVSDGRNRPSSSSSWQRSAKRKFPASACEPPPQARKPESVLRNSRGVRPQRQLPCIRKSLSDPLQVFGDGDARDNQHRSLSGTIPSDLKDRMQGRHEMTDMENLSREKRHGHKPGLKDSTNLDPKSALRQNSSHANKEVLALKEALRAEKEARRRLQAELDEERNASSSAATETMAMIARLQEEKAAVLMEARQFKRMAEERELHNQEAISLLKEMLLNKEEEALALENELATCRQMLLAIEAGESCDLKYLDIGSYRGRTLETELESTHFEEGLKSWTSSFCETKQFSVCTTNLSRETFKEEPTNSEFISRRFGRSFKDLVSDNVRGNLESFFNQAGEQLVELQNCNGVDFERELSKMMYDRTVESSMGADAVKRISKKSQGSTHNNEGSANCVEAKLTSVGIQPEQSVRGSKAAATPISLEKSFFGGSAESGAHWVDEQTRSLWERIMKLEHRLETVGVDERGLEFEFQGTVECASQTPGFTSYKEQANASPSDIMSYDGQYSEEANKKGNDSAERPTKLQCRVGSQGFETSPRQSIDPVVASHQNQSQGVSGMKCNSTLGEPSHETCDAVEGVHDVYEVGYQCNQSSQNDCCQSPVDDTSYINQPESHDKPDLPPELSAPDLETMDVSPPDSVDARNLSSSLSGAEVRQLSLRLQALESEKHSMDQAILSLQTENRELKLLQEIAWELQDLKQTQNLKRNVQTSEQPCKRAKSEQPSFTSFLRGFFSYLPSSSNLQDRSSLALPSRDVGSCAMQKDHVGLSHLLEKSPHGKTDTLIVRGLKVKVPAAI